MKRPCLALASILFVMIVTACGSEEKAAAPETAASTPEPQKITFMAGFKPQANLPFVGVYVAKEKGFFQEQGLDVDIQHSSGGSQHVQLLLAGQVQFTTADAANVLQRIDDPGLPLLAIALIGQTGQQGWVTLAGSGLDDPADWRGKTVGYRSTVPPDLLAILKARGMKLGDVNTQNIGYEPPQLLVEGRVDVYPVFLSNEPDTIRRKLGKEVTVFSAADYGMPTLGLTYVTTIDYADQHPETVTRFLVAVLRAIQWAEQNRDEAVEIVLKYAQGEDREHQRFMLDAEIEASDSPVTRANAWGYQTKEQWRELSNFLHKYGALDKAVNPKTAFTTRFLDAAYKELAWP
ncbi:MAG TPA: ABC transporter substrate-binding protein [Dehalococcoidia bacterium]|nr:ABC transporter substrate-binding protein [Dehalococcoidia bacterium]